MRGFYIKIPQMQKLGLTYEETFRMMKIVQRHEISYLRISVDSHPGISVITTH